MCISRERRALARARMPASVLLCTFYLGFANNPRAADDWGQRFLNDAPRNWQKYEAFAKRLQGKITATRKVQGSPEADYLVEYKQNDNCALVYEQVLSSEGQETALTGELLAFNSDYTFKLGRKSAEAPWVCLGVAKRQPLANDVTDTFARFTLLRSWEHLEHDAFLTNLIAQANFRLLSAVPTNDTGEELIRVDFDNTHSHSDKPFYAVQGGSLLLDAKHLCPLRSCEIGRQ